MGQVYSAQLMDHLRNPRNVGSLEDANVVVQAKDPESGDLLLYLLRIEGNVIRDIKFLVKGCGTAMAASSMATEMAKGKTVDEVLHYTEATVAEALGGLPEEKMHCAEMAVAALHAAMHEYLDFPASYEPPQGSLQQTATPASGEATPSRQAGQSSTHRHHGTLSGRRRRCGSRAIQPFLP